MKEADGLASDALCALCLTGIHPYLIVLEQVFRYHKTRRNDPGRRHTYRKLLLPTQEVKFGRSVAA